MMKNFSLLLVVFSTALLTCVAGAQTSKCNCDYVYTNGSIVEITPDDEEMVNNIATPFCEKANGDEVTIPDGAIRFCYGDGDNQWFDFYPATDSNGDYVTNNVPLFIYAHANGGKADDPGSKSIWTDQLKDNEINYLSWESVPTFNNFWKRDNIYKDLETVMDYIMDEALTYNDNGSSVQPKIDRDHIFMGGRSRGSVISWEYAMRNGNDIAGLYFAQAFPNGAWEGFDFADWVNWDSPPMVLEYANVPYTTDGHDPVNAQNVLSLYQAYSKNALVRHSTGFILEEIDGVEDEIPILFDELFCFLKSIVPGQNPPECAMSPDFTGASFDPLGVENVNGPELNSALNNTNAYCSATPAFEVTNTPSGSNICMNEVKDREPPIEISIIDNVYEAKTVTVEWTEDSSWSVYYDHEPSYQHKNDYYVIRYAQVECIENCDNSEYAENAEFSFLKAPRILKANRIKSENDNIGPTNRHSIEFELTGPYYRCTAATSDDYTLGVQVKCIVNARETRWSDIEVIDIDCDPSSSMVTQTVLEGNEMLNVRFTDTHTIVQSSTSGFHELRWFNALGQLAHNQQIYLSEGLNTIDQPVFSTQGLYILQVENSVSRVVRKVFMP